MNILLRCAFLGENFHGTQKQPDRKTVQGEFEKALSCIYDQKIKTVISSRLDAKVNALDFALSFAVDKDLPLERLSYYLRRTLDRDIFLKDVREVSKDFSARFSCKGKTYLYRIQNGKERNPLYNRFSFSPIKSLDEKKVEEGGRLFVGKHDFRSFATPVKEGENTILTLRSFSLSHEGPFLALRFEGESFLRYQVRFLVGALMSFSEGKITKETIQELLSGKIVPFRKYKAPGEGLTLERLEYEEKDLLPGCFPDSSPL